MCRTTEREVTGGESCGLSPPNTGHLRPRRGSQRSHCSLRPHKASLTLTDAARVSWLQQWAHQKWSPPRTWGSLSSPGTQGEASRALRWEPGEHRSPSHLMARLTPADAAGVHHQQWHPCQKWLPNPRTQGACPHMEDRVKHQAP